MVLKHNVYKHYKTNVEKMCVLGEGLKNKGKSEIRKESRRCVIEG